ncbi:beta-defensin 125 [Carlito syrichta]|uniref:Beta-defensin n=1 Tax=Carlito syrichta TaxID=1868482 RepID=A0A1U7T2N1_CARSF|nr:beta-defensin 125 [Carlito syrichta]
MNLLLLTFIICGLLTQATKASFGPQKCWKNNVGYCRRRCLDTERYIRLCRNKLSCCISIIWSYEHLRRPEPPMIHIDDITFDYTDWETFTGTSITRFPDAITFEDHTFRGNTITKATASETSTEKIPESKPPPSQISLVDS